MRTLVLKEKDKVSFNIPSDFIAFMTIVNRQIIDGDESAIIVSDDLLQCESAYGGLIEEGENIYSFTIFPEKGIHIKWEILLSKIDIQKISNGEMTTIQLWKCKNASCGCAFWDDKESCFYCDWV